VKHNEAALVYRAMQQPQSISVIIIIIISRTKEISVLRYGTNKKRAATLFEDMQSGNGQGRQGKLA